MLLSKSAIYGSKKPRLIKQKAKEISSSLRLKAPLNDIPLLSDNLF